MTGLALDFWLCVAVWAVLFIGLSIVCKEQKKIMTAEKVMRVMSNIRREFGTTPAMLAFACWLRVKDERILDIARVFVSRLDRPEHTPDWVRILANASHVDAVDDAWDDLNADLHIEERL